MTAESKVIGAETRQKMIRERVKTADAIVLREIVDATLQRHEPMAMYHPADDCPHDEPEDDSTREWDEYQDDHPYGANEYGEPGEGDRICMLSPTGEVVCRGCAGQDEEEELRTPWPCSWVVAVEKVLATDAAFTGSDR